MKTIRYLIKAIARFTRSTFWRDAMSFDDSGTFLVLPGVAFFGLFASVLCVIEIVTPAWFSVGIEITAFEVGGGLLGLLLVLRTNEGISRWWEARRLWGGINNQCRNIVIAALAYGPRDRQWRMAIVRWTAVFGHVCRRSLRGERQFPEIAALVGDAEADAVARAQHMPTYVALKLASLIREAVDVGMDRVESIQLERERASLIDHIGGCERILSTPLPRAYSIQIRRFIFLFIALVPFGLIPRFVARDPASYRVWFTPLITMLLAFPMMALDRIGAELQNPFSKANLNHLDLDGITTRIEANLFALHQAAAAVDPAPLA